MKNTGQADMSSVVEWVSISNYASENISVQMYGRLFEIMFLRKNLSRKYIALTKLNAEYQGEMGYIVDTIRSCNNQIKIITGTLVEL